MNFTRQSLLIREYNGSDGFSTSQARTHIRENKNNPTTSLIDQ